MMDRPDWSKQKSDLVEDEDNMIGEMLDNMLASPYVRAYTRDAC